MEWFCFFFFNLELMDLHKFDLLQSTTDIILIDTPVIPSLANENLFKLAPKLFWHNSLKFPYFLV